MKINKVLIANRGEIALRIMRSLREMGIKTVAVYSEADRQALHVRYADEAVFIGEAPSAKSYLDMQKIIQAAKNTQAEAIHPGYGFLSENAAFAQKVTEAGLIFIGPSADSIRVMGSKLGAKESASKFNVPMVPGSGKAVSDIQEAKEIAINIGFPVLIKASAGGGGKGMRIVEKAEEFEEQVKRASSEAQSAFGDGAVFIEKYISSPKHIEIQILGDQHGNVIHFFERECSVQRRYQKVVEEAPSPVVSPETRKAMGDAAVKVAKSCGYYGAGTVEFIIDENRNFYFLEMNTRLQVEHPVTEYITGVDLVKEQIKIAQGEKLSFTQEDLSIRGHAIELRVYAEDPTNNFLPDIGKITNYKRPQGPGIRVDDGFEKGMEIPVYYDPMIAKLTVYGATREEAIQRMIRAIDEYEITGVQTTLAFGKFVMQHEAFVNGSFDTHFVANYFKPEYLDQKLSEKEQQLIALVSGELVSEGNRTKNIFSNTYSKNWKQRSG
ncbi:MAG TPA: acetyl-CoA carboxylase biotin carboxylase subunit [Cytophagaceae bacterium]|nr:acetyl-CoA carboxylase biotin carboxylase subunit [Cytophagaceae bacterium]